MIIGFTGTMGSGKTEAAEYLFLKITKSGKRAQIRKFAEPMYKIQNYIYALLNLETPKPKDRKLLQFLGTDWGRSKDPNLWVNDWELNTKHAIFFGHTDIVLSDDVRFDNEGTKILDMGGKIIRIESTIDERKKRIPIEGTEHASEAGLSDKFITATVYNNGSLEDFHKNLDYLFETLNVRSDNG